MNIKKNIGVFAAVCLILFSWPLRVWADKCDDVAAQAKEIFYSAMDASKQKKHTKAIKLYKEAEQYYSQVSQMKNCRCPKIAGSSERNAARARNNAAKNREVLKVREKYGATAEILEAYNKAKKKFEQGNAYARSGQWQNAISAFEKAADIWEDIASTETENGRRATRAAKQARDFADLARLRKKMSAEKKETF